MRAAAGRGEAKPRLVKREHDDRGVTVQARYQRSVRSGAARPRDAVDPAPDRALHDEQQRRPASPAYPKLERKIR